jgi:hypothetical protein
MRISSFVILLIEKMHDLQILSIFLEISLNCVWSGSRDYKILLHNTCVNIAITLKPSRLCVIYQNKNYHHHKRYYNHSKYRKVIHISTTALFTLMYILFYVEINDVIFFLFSAVNTIKRYLRANEEEESFERFKIERIKVISNI